MKNYKISKKTIHVQYSNATELYGRQQFHFNLSYIKDGSEYLAHIQIDERIGFDSIITIIAIDDDLLFHAELHNVDKSTATYLEALMFQELEKHAETRLIALFLNRNYTKGEM
jgi:hypothetical protein